MSRDSIERLCDDHLEDILEYLSLSDKVKYECVSSQWQRCLYNRQNVLIIDGSDRGIECSAFDSLNNLVVKTKVDNVSNRVTVLRKEFFERILQKCKSIKKLVLTCCECDNEVLELIAENCPHLEDIECELIRVNPHDNCLIEFGQKLGKKLKRLRFIYFAIDYEIVKTFLDSCPKLELINCDILEAVVDQRPDFLPKLKNLRVRVRPTDAHQFEVLGEKYSKYVKSLESLTLYGNSQCFPEALRHVAAIESLRSLTFDLNCDISANRFVSNMNLLAEKLVNLKALVINSMVFISDQFFSTLGQFKNLSKLVINQNLLFIKSNSNISVSHLSGCQSLKLLAINGFDITEHFFDDISLCLPQLKSIEFSLMTDTVITDRLFRMFQSMEMLERFSFTLIINKAKKVNYSALQNSMSQLVCITDNGLSQLILNAHKLRIIELKDTFVPFVGQKTFEAIIEKALAHPKWKFVVRIRSEKDVLTCCDLKETINMEKLPTNLSIELTTDHDSNKTHN